MSIDSTRGQLLIAGPTLTDPNFLRTVVLVIEHSEAGALGLVLNRPSETTVGEVVSELEALLAPEEPLWVGGPVAPSALIVLAEFAQPDDAALIAFADIGVLASESEDGPPEIRRGRAFVGHAGWGPGQLDAELESGDWFVEPALREDAFTERPEDLWADVLTRMGGHYALVARMPLDPSVN
ncbi:MAG TPA: YqgE/AlgH family protein [Solirubrobacteraceae bacterium]|nr:YqgE/AlgH family protein [Solirubrobacteraceae bacterium]